MTREEWYINRVLDVMPMATPMRSQIATELRGHIAERIAHGGTVDDVLRQLGDPVRLAESYLAAVPLVSASFGQRAAAKIIDVSTVLLVMVPTAWLLARLVPLDQSGSEGGGFLLPILILVAVLGGSIVFGMYLVFAEAWLGQTLGKRLLGIAVVRESGARIGIGQSIVRQLPIFLQVYWIDAFFALFTEKRQRAFELLSKTRVVLAPPQEVR